jgi:hypothetical protein
VQIAKAVSVTGGHIPDAVGVSGSTVTVAAVAAEAGQQEHKDAHRGGDDEDQVIPLEPFTRHGTVLSGRRRRRCVPKAGIGAN